jgi:phosphate transport system substrate-binding protein
MLFRSVALALVGAVAIVGASSAQVRLHGSATVGKGIVVPNQSKIESDAGDKLAVVSNGSGNGLIDLAEGRADVAMISADLDFEMGQVDKKKPGALSGLDLQAHPIGANKVNFIVHPSNPVKSLTQDQVAGILSGKIKDWSEIGGPAGKIVVFAERPGNGTRATVEKQFLGGKEIFAGARLLAAPNQLVKAASQTPTAFSYGNGSTIDGTVAVIAGVEANQPLSIVTKGAPSDEHKKLISAIAKAAK